MLGSYGLQTSTYANYAISMGNYLQTCLNAYGGKLIEDIAANLDNLDAGAQSDNLSGYYQDANGRWHRPNGQFASNAEVGISSSDKILTGTHGNSLANASTNYGYALVDRDTNEILKFGETLYPDTRYSQSYLDANNAKMIILEQGNKADIHYWQYDMNNYIKEKYGEYPPLVISPNGY